MIRFLIATGNQAKVAEVHRFLGDLPVSWKRPADVSAMISLQETGVTFRENALEKARMYAQATGLPTLANDSGLVIPALGGWPGLHTRRAKDGAYATDEEIVAIASQRIRELTPPDRQYRFESVFAFVTPEGKEYVGEGSHSGELLHEPHPDSSPGFPYRRFWYLPQFGKHFLDLDASEQAAVNHNRQALQALRPSIEAYVEMR